MKKLIESIITVVGIASIFVIMGALFSADLDVKKKSLENDNKYTYIEKRFKSKNTVRCVKDPSSIEGVFKCNW